MIAELVKPLVAALVLLGAAVGVSRGRCPAGWYVEGVRPSGEFWCRPVLGEPDRDIEDARDGIDLGDDRQLRGAIHCTGGAHPVVNGPRTVGCQR